MYTLHLEIYLLTIVGYFVLCFLILEVLLTPKAVDFFLCVCVSFLESSLVASFLKDRQGFGP